MIGIKRVNYIFFHILIVFTSKFFFSNQNVGKESNICKISKITEISMLEVSNITLIDDLEENTTSNIVSDGNSGDQPEKIDITDINETFLREDENLENKATHAPKLNISEELIKPSLKMIWNELINMYNFLKSEYRSISSKSVIDKLEDCVNKRKFIDDILQMMFKARKLLYSEEKKNTYTNSSLKRKERKYFKNKKSPLQDKKNKISDLFFYLQTNISILKKTSSVYFNQYHAFLNREKILGDIVKLLNEMNLLISGFKNKTFNTSEYSIEQLIEINRPISRLIGDYNSLLGKIQIFTSSEHYLNNSKNIEFYLQAISCRLKYRLQDSSIFDELRLSFDSKFEPCK